MVGFNRRFSPLIRKMKNMISYNKFPKAILITINAGYIPNDHWVQDKKIGGGRIIGEVYRFVDLLRFLIGCKIVSYQKNTMSAQCNDNFSLNIAFSDRSIGSINYLSNGSKHFPKERIEVFAGGAVLQLNNLKI